MPTSSQAKRMCSRLASLDGMTVKTYSFDLHGENAVDFLKEQPYGDILDTCRPKHRMGTRAGSWVGLSPLFAH